MTVWVSVADLWVESHLPGRHDQRDHGRGTVSNQLKYLPDPGHVARVGEGVLDGIRLSGLGVGIEPEVAANIILGNLRVMIDDNPVAVRLKPGLFETVMDSGELKTQFETGTSGGVFDLDWRQRAERQGLGIPDSARLRDRPIYGYVRISGSLVHPYGSVELILKKSVRDRTTITVGDSLFGFGRGTKVGSPMLNPQIGSLERSSHSLSGVMLRDVKNFDYVEAQVQGGVRLRDIEKVVFHRQPSGQRGVTTRPGLLPRLRELGLKFEVSDTR